MNVSHAQLSFVEWSERLSDRGLTSQGHSAVLFGRYHQPKNFGLNGEEELTFSWAKCYLKLHASKEKLIPLVFGWQLVFLESQQSEYLKADSRFPKILWNCWRFPDRSNCVWLHKLAFKRAITRSGNTGDSSFKHDFALMSSLGSSEKLEPPIICDALFAWLCKGNSSDRTK